jgi:2-keto-4-pentenoate hydratase/2-oxohepta-3-ene-1,7-dioic acid hydratase in catechol pathway
MKSVVMQKSGEKIPVGKILCLGFNYAKHIDEMKGKLPGDPVIFMKPPTSLIYTGDTIVLPEISMDVHYEAELVVLIGKDGRKINKSSAYDYVEGYGAGIDVTLRDVQVTAKEKGQPWTIAKGFDTSAPVSAFTEKDAIKDPHKLTLKLWVNDELKQDSTTEFMISKINDIIEYISRFITLERGDLIFTGTPEGVGKLNDGDTVKTEIEGVGAVECSVKSE